MENEELGVRNDEFNRIAWLGCLRDFRGVILGLLKSSSDTFVRVRRGKSGVRAGLVE